MHERYAGNKLVFSFRLISSRLVSSHLILVLEESNIIPWTLDETGSYVILKKNTVSPKAASYNVPLLQSQLALAAVRSELNL